MATTLDTTFAVRMDVVSEKTGDMWTIETRKVKGIVRAGIETRGMRLWSELRCNRLPDGYAYYFSIPRDTVSCIGPRKVEESETPTGAWTREVYGVPYYFERISPFMERRDGKRIAGVIVAYRRSATRGYKLVHHWVIP